MQQLRPSPHILFGWMADDSGRLDNPFNQGCAPDDLSVFLGFYPCVSAPEDEVRDDYPMFFFFLSGTFQRRRRPPFKGNALISCVGIMPSLSVLSPPQGGWFVGGGWVWGGWAGWGGWVVLFFLFYSGGWVGFGLFGWVCWVGGGSQLSSCLLLRFFEIFPPS